MRESLKVNQHKMFCISNVEFCPLLHLVMHGLKFSFKVCIAEVATSFFSGKLGNVRPTTYPTNSEYTEFARNVVQFILSLALNVFI